jgi:hypothetical protein
VPTSPPRPISPRRRSAFHPNRTSNSRTGQHSDREPARPCRARPATRSPPSSPTAAAYTSRCPPGPTKSNQIRAQHRTGRVVLAAIADKKLQRLGRTARATLPLGRAEPNTVIRPAPF